jgi:phosphoribosylformylglycinamidine synthase subunit PurL
VPLREADMEPFEIMVSESQERMLAIVEPAKLDRVLAVCERWQTAAAAIGEVTSSPEIRVLREGEAVGEVPVSILIDGCPLYDLEPAEPDAWIYPNPVSHTGTDASEILLELLATPTVASKRWAFEQYDSIVGSRTVRRPEGADAAVLSLPETEGAIAVAIDGNGRRVACDPYRGTIEAVLECAQNLACVGAEPLGLTNCLNFGNPEKPHVAWQLDRSTQGLADACEALGIPVVGGNVSLYNETDQGPIYPTPVVGLVGELPDPARTASSAIAQGEALALVGPFAPSLAGSELAKLRGELGPGLPETDVGAVRRAIEVVRETVRAGTLTVAHDVSEGGLACAVAEMAVTGGVGASVDLDPLVELRGCSGETALFGEAPGGFVVASDAETIRQLRAAGESAGVDVLEIGVTGGDLIELSAAETGLSLPLTAAERAWRSLGTSMEEPPHA